MVVKQTYLYVCVKQFLICKSLGLKQSKTNSKIIYSRRNVLGSQNSCNQRVNACQLWVAPIKTRLNSVLGI